MKQKKLDRIKRVSQRKTTTAEQRIARASAYNKVHGMPEPREGR